MVCSARGLKDTARSGTQFTWNYSRLSIFTLAAAAVFVLLYSCGNVREDHQGGSVLSLRKFCLRRIFSRTMCTELDTISLNRCSSLQTKRFYSHLWLPSSHTNKRIKNNKLLTRIKIFRKITGSGGSLVSLSVCPIQHISNKYCLSLWNLT